MNSKRWTLAAACLLLAACTARPDPPQNPEQVSIVLYHPLRGMNALKTVGDWAMLSTGELLQIETSLVLALLPVGHTSLPVPDGLLELRSRVWVEDSHEIRGRGEVRALLDRRNGVMCVGTACSPLIAICPPVKHAMATNGKCRGFNAN